jgi:hypothetical protein
MDPIKEAFLRAKQDISDLKEAVENLRKEISDLKSTFPTANPTSFQPEQINTQSIPTPYLNEPSKSGLYGPLSSNTNSSIGNKGVPTNKQTNKQTNQHTRSGSNNEEKTNISSVISSFNIIKEEIQRQFRSLTKQEMEVFSSIYMLEDQGHIVDYPSLASSLSLSEISIRDYILKMTRKGIPIIKSRQNNNKILLSIDPSLKKIASLSSLLLLREQ